MKYTRALISHYNRYVVCTRSAARSLTGVNNTARVKNAIELHPKLGIFYNEYCEIDRESSLRPRTTKMCILRPTKNFTYSSSRPTKNFTHSSFRPPKLLRIPLCVPQKVYAFHFAYHKQNDVPLWSVFCNHS